jgi:hypothetical protein
MSRVKTFALDHSFGKDAECSSYDDLKGLTKGDLIHNTDIFAPWDFESEDLLIEMKTRYCSSGDYPTAMLQYKKVMRACQDESGRRIIFAFRYTDGLYVIDYDPVDFSGYEIVMSQVADRPDYKERPEPRIYIPISDLKCIKRYLTIE